MNDQELKVVANFLVHHFLRMQRILFAIASNESIGIGGGELFFDINRIYILSHEGFFHCLEIEGGMAEFESLRNVVSAHWFSSYATLESFLEWHEASLLSDHIRSDIDPIAAEVTRIATKHGISQGTYYGMDVTESFDEKLSSVGKELQDLYERGADNEELRRESEAILSVSRGILWQQFLDKHLSEFLSEYKKLVKTHEERLFGTRGEDLSFDKEAGRVSFGGKNLWILKKGTREHALFSALFENAGKSLSHLEIGKYLNVVEFSQEANEYRVKTMEKTLWNYISDIKGRLPKEIRRLITSHKGGYILDINALREK